MTESRTTVVRFSGGLGNQLFQYAHLLGLLASGAQVRADLSWYRRHGAQQGRAPEITALLDDVRVLNPMHGARLAVALRSRSRDRGPGDAIDRVGRVDVHSGYWQDWSAVAGVRDALVERLARIPDLAPRPVLSPPHVALHVRLGDYLSPGVAAFHGVTDAAAQLNLAERIRIDHGLDGVVIFTDSPDVVAPMLSGTSKATLSSASTAWQALAGMSEADSLVMSNSSLSWWAATISGWRDPRPGRAWMPRPWLARPSPLDERLMDPGWSTYERKLPQVSDL